MQRSQRVSDKSCKTERNLSQFFHKPSFMKKRTLLLYSQQKQRPERESANPVKVYILLNFFTFLSFFFLRL